MKKLIVFAGPNGSGKSTIISQQRNNPGFPEKYICPDITVNNYLYISNEKKRYIKAMNDCENLRYMYIKRGISFTFETVFSSKNKLDFLVYARKHGYFVEVIYITTKDPHINIKRVKQRVASGGHDVPEDKIISRYQNSMLLLPKIINVCNTVTVVDNSGRIPIIVFAKEDNTLYLLNKENRNNPWTEKYVIKPLIDSGYQYTDFIDLTVSETKKFLK